MHFALIDSFQKGLLSNVAVLVLVLGDPPHELRVLARPNHVCKPAAKSHHQSLLHPTWHPQGPSERRRHQEGQKGACMELCWSPMHSLWTLMHRLLLRMQESNTRRKDWTRQGAVSHLSTWCVNRTWAELPSAASRKIIHERTSRRG